MIHEKILLTISLFLIFVTYNDLEAASKVSCVLPDEPIYEPWTSDLPQKPICKDPKLISIPESFRQIIDLTEHQKHHQGSCSQFLKEAKFIEIDASLGFPIQIKLPIVDSKDEFCNQECKQQDFAEANPNQETFYSLVFKFKDDFYPGAFGGNLVFRVEDPWFFITGNEGKAIACLNGYPSILEYGKPLACANTHVTQFGIASNSLIRKSATLIIDLVSWTNLTSPCCPYICQKQLL